MSINACFRQVSSRSGFARREGDHRRWQRRVSVRGNGHMSKPRQLPQILIFAITVFFALPTASHAQVKVLMSGGFSAAYQELLPEFQNTTGIAVSTSQGASQGNGPNPLALSFVEGCPPTS